MKRRLIALKVLLEQEKKKASALAALMLLLVIALIRAGLTLGPSRGVAAPAEEASGVSSLASAGRDAVSRAIASDDAFNSGRLIEVPRSPRTSRNLFALDTAHFPLARIAESGEGASPPPGQSEQATQIPGGEGPSGDTGGKPVESPAWNADDEAKRQRAQRLEETTGWRLTSVMLGQKPTAVVETPGVGGRGAPRSNVLRAGQSLREWLVVEITASTVVLEKQTVRVRLSIAKPEH